MTLKVRVTWKGAMVSERVEQAAERGAFKAGERLLAYANESVPLMDGPLQASGEVSVTGAKGSVKVSYNTPYAIRLHEHPEYRFLRMRRGKWLERSLEEIAAELQDIMAGEVRKELQ